MENHSRFVLVRFLLVFTICCVHGNAGQTSGSIVGEKAAPSKTTKACTRGQPKNCADIKRERPSLPSRTCLIYPFGTGGQSVEAFCDLEKDGGGWTIIQKRSSGPKEEFYRGWASYENGFGSADKNYWLGLKAIRELTKSGDQELRIDLWDFEGNKAYAKYLNFSISDSSDSYRLTIGGFSGTAGDSMTRNEYGRNLSGMRFSTKEKDNDGHDVGSCAELYKGGWWYNRCLDSNLNGLYLAKGEYVNGTFSGIVWFTWRNSWRSLRQVEMKVRQRR